MKRGNWIVNKLYLLKDVMGSSHWSSLKDDCSKTLKVQEQDENIDYHGQTQWKTTPYVIKLNILDSNRSQSNSIDVIYPDHQKVCDVHKCELIPCILRVIAYCVRTIINKTSSTFQEKISHRDKINQLLHFQTTLIIFRMTRD